MHHHGHSHRHFGHSHGPDSPPECAADASQPCGEHAHRPTSRAGHRRRLKWSLALVASYMLAEVVGGLASGSLALLADAGHMLSDVAALGLGLFAAWLADRPSPSHRTYGHYRAEILAALANGALLAAVSILVMIEAVHRFWEPPAVQGPLMLAVATGGLAVNLAGLWILHGGVGESINVRAAWLHMLSDTLGSLAVLTAGGLIWLFGWYWVDPVASAAIALLIVVSAWRLLAEAVSVLMEFAPASIDVDEVDAALREAEGVRSIHDLHVWSLTTGLDALSVHIVMARCEPGGELLKSLQEMLRERFGIRHVTIQLEPPEFEDCQAPFW